MLLLTLLLAADLCAGRITDKAPHPMLPAVFDPVTLTPIQGVPPVGKSYLDGSFGTLVTPIVRPPASEGDNAIIKTTYSTMGAWNADESLFLAWHREKGHELYAGDGDYHYIGNLGLSPTDIEHVFWDRENPHVLYYTRTRPFEGAPTGERPRLMQVILSPQRVESVAYDFSLPPTNCPIAAPRNRFGMGSNPEVKLGPRSIIGLVCGTEGQTKILFSIKDRKVLAYGTNPGFGPVAPIPSPTEQQVLLEPGWVLDIALGYLRRLTEKFYFEHSQVGEGLGGGVKNTVAFDSSSPGANDSGQLVSHSLVTGQAKVIIGPSTGYPYIPSLTHVSTTGPAGWALVGSVGTRTGTLVMDGEIALANTDTGQVCRLAHTRTWAGSCLVSEGCYWGYWGESHPVLSPTGTRIAFTSDGRGFGVDTGAVGVYVVDLRKPRVKVRVKTTCDLGSLSPVQAEGCQTEGYEVVP
jgi:hypothetical protein